MTLPAGGGNLTGSWYLLPYDKTIPNSRFGLDFPEQGEGMIARFSEQRERSCVVEPEVLYIYPQIFSVEIELSAGY